MVTHHRIKTRRLQLTVSQALLVQQQRLPACNEAIRWRQKPAICSLGSSRKRAIGSRSRPGLTGTSSTTNTSAAGVLAAGCGADFQHGVVSRNRQANPLAVLPAVVAIKIETTHARLFSTRGLSQKRSGGRKTEPKWTV